MPVQCLVVDDSQRFVDAARGLLERQGITVVGVASSGAEALAQAARLRPDVTLVDINLGDESGFDVVRQLSRRRDLAPSTAILISAQAESDYADLIAASPAAGFLSKTAISGDAIRNLLGRHDGNHREPHRGPRGA
jgi:DNA-binding NarL/FixJ family response regulator